MIKIMEVKYKVLIGDCLSTLRTLPDQSVHMCVTSPPYFGLRDYGMEGQIGLESSPDAFIARLVEVFREVRRVLRDDGTLWLNLGDSYAATTKGSSGVGKNATNKGSILKDRSWQVPTGLKPKDLIGIPWRVAFALQADGWYLRQDIIWHKPNPMPESVKDRCTKAHEYVFLLSKSPRYYFDSDAIKEEAIGTRPNNPEWQKQRAATNAKKGAGNRNAADGGFTGWDASKGRNRRSVWTVTTKPYAGAHFATFPPDLIEPCILAGSPVGGVVLDPFGGSGTSAGVALKNSRNAVLCELNPDYAALMPKRIAKICGDNYQKTDDVNEDEFLYLV